MPYRLKRGQETFTVVDGPDAGKTFKRGREYDRIPDAEKHRFEKVPEAKAPAAEKPQEDKKTRKKGNTPKE